MNNSQSTPAVRAWAIAGTVLFHGAVLALLLLLVLSVNRSRDAMLEEMAAQALDQKEDDEEVLLPGEYVTVGDDFYEPATTPVETAPPSDKAPLSAAAEEIITSTAESPVKVPPKRDKATSDTERARAREKQAEERREQQAKTIDSRVRFGNKGEGDGSGYKPGSVDGTVSSGGTLSGQPGANMRGRTLASWHSPTATSSGTIVIAVRVDRKGKVVDAAYSHGTGTVASSREARASCIAAARRSSFSVDDSAPAEQTGTITYRFLPPKH